MLGRLGDYELLSELGRGGMGLVYAARHATLGRPVALKVLHAGIDPSFTARFSQEAQTLARLRHPNIVAVHEGQLEGPRPFLVMELVEGESLAARLARTGPLPPREAVEHILGAAAGLAHAHAQGVVHRDLKPGNVLLGTDGVARLTDFGLARGLSEDRERLTRTGELMGTPAYMAPEQVDDAKSVDARADVYGLAATLYALLAGQAPFSGESPTNVIVKVLRDPPAPPSVHAPGVPTDLDWIVLEALRKKPDERYPSVEAFAADLRHWLAGEPIKAGPPPRELPLWLLAPAVLVVLALATAVLWPTPAAPVPATPPKTGGSGGNASEGPPPRTPPPSEVRERRRRPQEIPVTGARGTRIAPLGDRWCLALGDRGAKEGVFWNLAGDLPREVPWAVSGGVRGLAAVGDRLLVSSWNGPLLWCSPRQPNPVEAELPLGEGRYARNMMNAARAPVVAFEVTPGPLAPMSEVWVCREVEGKLKKILTLSEDVRDVYLELSPKGDYLLVVPKGVPKRTRLSLWSVETGEAIWREDVGKDIQDLAFSPDLGGETFFAYGGEPSLVVRRLSGEAVEEAQSLVDPNLPVGVEGAHLTTVDGMEFGADGKLYSISSGTLGGPGELKVWKLAPGDGTWSYERTVPLEVKPIYLRITLNRDWLLLGTQGASALALPIPLRD